MDELLSAIDDAEPKEAINWDEALHVGPGAPEVRDIIKAVGARARELEVALTQFDNLEVLAFGLAGLDTDAVEAIYRHTLHPPPTTLLSESSQGPPKDLLLLIGDPDEPSKRRLVVQEHTLAAALMRELHKLLCAPNSRYLKDKKNMSKAVEHALNVSAMTIAGTFGLSFGVVFYLLKSFASLALRMGTNALCTSVLIADGH